MLRPFDLTYTILSERLVVTTREREEERISVAVYPVNRLVGAGPKGRSFQSLVDLLQATVTPDSWGELGGPAMVRWLDGEPACLVISHSTAGHRAVDAFLRSLR
jgi:anti-sigma factor RsiW